MNVIPKYSKRVKRSNRSRKSPKYSKSHKSSGYQRNPHKPRKLRKYSRKYSRKSSKYPRKLRKYSRKFSTSTLKKTLLAGAGITGTAYAIKQLSRDYSSSTIYEETKYITTGQSSDIANVDFENLSTKDIPVRAKNYTHSNKLKQPGPDTLYDTTTVKLIRNDSPLEGTAPLEKIPVSKFSHIQNNSYLPTYIYVNVILPKLDQTNFSVIFVYTIKPDTIATALKLAHDTHLSSQEVLSIDDNTQPAIHLLHKFITDEKFRKEGKGRFKIIPKVHNYGQIITYGPSIWIANKGVRPFTVNKPLRLFTIGKTTIIEIDVRKFTIPKAIHVVLKTIDDIASYYSQVDKFNADIGFVIEGEEKSELPESLLGATKIKGVEMVINPVKYFVGHESRLNIIWTHMGTDLQTVEKQYSGHILEVLALIKHGLENTIATDPANFPKLPSIPYSEKTESTNKKLFFSARFFYYKNLHNDDFFIQNPHGVYYNASSKNPSWQLYNAIASYFTGPDKYIAQGTCFSNNTLYNFYKCTGPYITTFRFGTSIKNALDPSLGIDFAKEVVTGVNHLLGHKRPIFCISLLTPCNTIACKAIKLGSKLLPKEAYFSFLENDLIESERNTFTQLSDIYVNVPLSSNHGILFNSTVPINTVKNIQTKIDVSTGESTFKTLVKLTILYYFEYSNHYTLCYHCKSGKDRTSICDAIVQATMHNIHSITKGTEPSETIYAMIKKDAIYYLLAGYVITFYSTGVPGIKMGNMPVAKYLLGENSAYYNFFKGNSRLSSS